MVENFKKEVTKESTFSSVQKLTLSGVTMALYIAIMFMTQAFAFGQIQIRIATSLYGLTALFPFLVIPMGLANTLSNTLMGGLGVFDMVGGFFVGIITAGIVYLIRRYQLNDWFIALPIILGPGLIVPIWLSYLIGVPYQALAFSIIMGQILPGILGVVLVKHLRRKMKIY